MIRSSIAAVFAALSLAAPVFATGDPVAGERGFNKCRSCHAIVADDGTEIFRGGRSGPNLFGVIGRNAAGAEGFRYSPAMIAAGDAGFVWNPENLVEYLADPTRFLRAYLDDGRARSNMSFKLAQGGEDIVAYLASVVQ